MRNPTPATVIAAVALFFALGGGSYAAVSAGPTNSVLAQRITLLNAKVTTLQATVAHQQQDIQTVAAADKTTLDSTSCLIQQWNNLIYFPQSLFVWNTVYYSGLASSDLSDGILAMRNVTATLHQC